MPTLTKLYSMEEASQHNTTDDCWVVIDGKAPSYQVYDVSTYMDDHPGGDDVFLRASGKDALEEFEDAGHSKSARELMEQYVIGELDSPIPAIPELEIVPNKSSKVLNITKQYWVVPVAIVGVSVAIGILYRMKK